MKLNLHRLNEPKFWDGVVFGLVLIAFLLAFGPPESMCEEGALRECVGK